MKRDTITDIIKFYMLMGACNKLAEKNFPENEIIDESYKKTIDTFCEKYNINHKDKSVDGYLNVEIQLDILFTTILSEEGEKI